MKTLNFILICLLLTSCLTVKRIEKNCDKFAKVCVTPTTVTVIKKDTTIFIHDTIFVTLPKDTVYLTNTITVKDGVATMPKVTKSYGVISVSAWVDKSVLSVYAFLKDSTILVPVRDTVTITTTDTVTNNTVVLPPVKFIPKFYKFTFWVFMILVLGLVGYGIYWVKGGAIKSAINKLKK